MDTTIGDLAKRFQAGGHGAYPIVDGDGRCVGIIARGDLLRNPWPDDTPAGAVSADDVVSVASSDTVIDALERILEEQIEHLPVVDDGRLVGICAYGHHASPASAIRWRTRRAGMATPRSFPLKTAANIFIAE